MTNIPVITIDGPSGTGKGTLASRLAVHLGWHFLDSGAIYRVLAFAASSQEVAETDAHKLVELAGAMKVRFGGDDIKTQTVHLYDQDVTAAIRTQEIGSFASKISALPDVREALLGAQRRFREAPGLVADGRDMGTVVFEDADLKLFLTASPEVRAQRRHRQLTEKGSDVSLSRLIDAMRERDERDRQREVSPLVAAPDALTIDTSEMSIDKVFEQVLQRVHDQGLDGASSS